MAHGVAKIAAAIGVMKVGLAWVPMDATLHDNDLAKLISFADANVVLTDEKNHSRKEIGKRNRGLTF